MIRHAAWFLLWPGLVLAMPGDIDDDSILDPVDNCLEAFNPDQRDEDRDGFGTACDPDFDNDGDVDSDDVRALARRLGRGPEKAKSPVPARLRPYDPLFDLNGDGRLTGADMQVLQGRRGKGPGPVQDGDGDGVPDAADRCPDSLGGPEVFPGCGAVDLLAAPRFVLAPTRQALARLADTIDVVSPELRSARGLVIEALEPLSNAAAAAGEGDACAAERLLRDAEESVASAQAMFLSRPLPPDRGPVGAAVVQPVAGDASMDGSIIAERELLASLAGRVIDDLANVGGGMGRACTGATRGRTSGVLGSVDDAARTLTLEDGRTFALADHHRIAGVVVPGVLVELDGLFFEADDTGLVGETLAIVPDFEVPTLLPCIRPRFAPPQPGFLVAAAPKVLHDPRGYEVAGQFEIERRSGFGAFDNCPRPSPRQRVVPRYWLQMSITAPGYAEDVFALQVRGGDRPVPLPAWVDQGVAGAELTVVAYRADCEQGSQSLRCGDVTELRTDVYPLTVRPYGAYCAATLQTQVVAVDDQQPGDFALDRVTTYFGPYSLPNASFVGEAYAANGSLSVVPVGLNQDYAVRNQDFYPILKDTGLQALWAELLSGVDKPSGLRWPRVAGTRNGHAYRYACTVPRVVRDVVDFCPGPESFFRLPFAKEESPWEQSQGNQSGGTHGNGFAYDMVSACSVDIRAARAGVVEAVTESNTQQMWNDCTDDADCPGHTCCPAGQDCDENRLWVRHQDGTYGEYVHFAPMGILPQVGDVVKRGELVGSMGTTGNSSGPHLHFAWKQLLGNGNTILARFEVRDPTSSDPGAPNAPLATCYEPRNYPAADSPHRYLYSTNEP